MEKQSEKVLRGEKPRKKNIGSEQSTEMLSGEKQQKKNIGSEQSTEMLGGEKQQKRNIGSKQSTEMLRAEKQKKKNAEKRHKLEIEFQKMDEGIAYAYMVECGDGSLYTGWTNHLEERMKCHNEGKGAKYTRSRLPVRLVYYETFASKQEAMKREYAIKQLTRKDKLQLIAQQPKERSEKCKLIAETTACAVEAC